MPDGGVPAARGIIEIVKKFDDGITEPDLDRAYDCMAQFSEKEEIKEDYQV